jgi:CRP-like cAMP-binding protein
MARTTSTRFSNRLLIAMSAADMALLEPHLNRVDFQRRRQLEFPDRKIQSVYFIEQGVVSVVARVEGEENEICVIGREGMTGTPLALDCDRTPCAAFVQIPGFGYEMPADVFRNVLSRSDSLRLLILRYTHILSLQMAFTLTAATRGNLEERLARWLLMAHDRVGSDNILLTDELLALMLGTRRPGVTEALHALAGHGLIQGDRGRIQILDRSGLERIVGKFYGTPEREYERLVMNPG